MPPPLTHEVGQLAFQSVGVGAAVLVVVLLTRRLLAVPVAAPRAAAAAIAALALVSALGHLGGDRQMLGTARRLDFNARAGTDFCFVEDGVASEVPFLRWVRRQLPVGAVYRVDELGEPDPWCLTLALLPAIPTGPGNIHPRWEIAFGQIPAPLQSRITRGDRTVRVYAPNFALARIRG